MGKVYGIIPAAGSGNRMGKKIKKQYLNLGDKPVLVHTLQCFECCSEIDGVVLVTAQQDVDFCLEQIVKKYGLQKVQRVISGGAERQYSVYNGLTSLAGEEDDIVLVHDGARPLLTPDMLLEVIASVRKYGSAVMAVPVKDTVKLADQSGWVENTPPREKLWAVQTPQAFHYGSLVQAHLAAQKSGFLGTDESSLVENLGLAVRLLQGSYENIKITTPEDLLLAEAILKRREKSCE